MSCFRALKSIAKELEADEAASDFRVNVMQILMVLVYVEYGWMQHYMHVRNTYIPTYIHTCIHT